MTAVQEPRNGIWYGWALGENAWDTQMNANLKKMGVLLQISVLDRDLSTPPASPTDGASYIVGGAPTGLWAAHANDIAVWVVDDSEWFFLTPENGWLCFIVDESVLSAYITDHWSTGVSLGT